MAKRETLKQVLAQMQKQMKEMSNPSQKSQIALPFSAIFSLSSSNKRAHEA